MSHVKPMEMRPSTSVGAVCPICQTTQPSSAETARVRSNVRAFQKHVFTVWRCANCHSIHLADAVDLEKYYAQYPYHGLRFDFIAKMLYTNQLSRLVRAGLTKDMSILDYGCGGGNFIRYLQSRGYSQCFGYDEYSQYNNPEVLTRSYDCLISQDVIEHVPEPIQLLSVFHRLAKPGGIIAVGTPNAEAIDLRRPEDFEHPLHQPYHLHIFSKKALLAAGVARGWELVRYYPSMYANTRLPYLNSGFYRFYAKLYDNSMDVLLEPIRTKALWLRPLQTAFWALFGSFNNPSTDVMAVFRRR